MAVHDIPYTTAGNFTYDPIKVIVSGGLATLNEDLTHVYARWHMNESSGSNVPDSSGNGRNGTTQNMEDGDWVAAKLNNGLQFDGVNERVDCGTIAGFERTDAFSLECWFNHNDVAGGRDLMGKWDGTSGYLIYLTAAKRVGVYIKGPTGIIDVASTTTGLHSAWHHLVITYDGSSEAAGLHMYIDSSDETLVVTTDTLASSILNSSQFQLADCGSVWDPMSGILDEVLIWTKELSPAEVSYRYNGGSGREIDPYWSDGPGVYRTLGSYDARTTAWASFTETLGGGNEGLVRYQLSGDGNNWFYWVDTEWVSAGDGDYNTQAEVSDNIEDFPATTKTIYVMARLISDGFQVVELDNNKVYYLVDPVDSIVSEGGVPTAPLRIHEIDVDCDDDYPDGGYDVTDNLPDDYDVLQSYVTPDYDGAALRYLQLGTDNKVHVYADDNGAKGAEVSASTDCSGHTGVKIGFVTR